LGKYTSGPDETDLQVAMCAVGALHCGRVMAAITPASGSESNGLRIAIGIHLDVLPGSSLPAEIIVESRWPCPDCVDLVAHLYGQVVMLDFAIEKAYNSLPLPGTG